MALSLTLRDNEARLSGEEEIIINLFSTLLLKGQHKRDIINVNLLIQLKSVDKKQLLCHILAINIIYYS